MPELTTPVIIVTILVVVFSAIIGICELLKRYRKQPEDDYIPSLWERAGERYGIAPLPDESLASFKRAVRRARRDCVKRAHQS